LWLLGCSFSQVIMLIQRLRRRGIAVVSREDLSTYILGRKSKTLRLVN